MKLIGLLLALVIVCWLFYGWFLRFNGSSESSLGTTTDFETSVTAPIEAAEDARDALENRF